MRELQGRDFRALNEGVLALSGDDRAESFSARLAAALSLLVPADLTAVECFDKSARWKGRLLGDSAGVIERHFPAFLRQSATHPLFPLLVSGRLYRQPTRLSDVITRPRLYELAIFDEFLKPMGVDAQMIVAILLGDGSADVLVLSRKGCDFSSRERQRLEAFLPHLVLSRRRAAFLERYRNQEQVDIATDDVRHSLARLQSRLGLTRREVEIVWWLTMGKSDRAIADRCGIQQRTVQKHCENIYRKLGVTSRTATVMRALGQLT